MWIFLVEIAGVLLSLFGWFGFHSFGLLAAGSILIVIFDVLMSSSGGQIKNYGLSILLAVAGGVFGGLSGYGILTAALLAFSVYSAIILILKMILLILAVMNRE